MFLPFLQGAQIATHSSCQGNGAGYPMECLPCAACAGCPRGGIHSSSSAPPQLLLIRPSSGAPPSTWTHTPLQKLISGVSGPRRRASLPSLPVTPSPDSSSHAYIRSPLFSPPPPLPSVSAPMLAHALLARGDTPPTAARHHTPAQAE